ncbi:uncharacterized protein LOC128708407 [Anopheles marshallii]|uniref:uncharacterized protein LOC128708407 n=1 Tax=Anopheles marshallii TaxID=1521116 RepID=UPI00237AA130|nr:uncharacterized protein LOC128708407 [Anopheles marshallii]
MVLGTRRTLGWRELSITLVLLVACPLLSRGEMRKSWQTKSVDVQAQMLKAARLDDPPHAKPPEPSFAAEESNNGAVTERPDTHSTSAGVKATDELKAKPAGVFSSRVRNKYGTTVGAVATDKPVEDGVTPQQDGVRAVPLGYADSPEDIQIDDATVQDDDDDDDEDDDEDDVLGWNGTKGDKDQQYDLIKNILEEVEGRIAGEKRDEADELARSKAKKPTERAKEYTFPPVLNMTIDEPNNIVKVKLNQDIVRDMLNTGREAGGGIGGKKMLRYVLPLFILPFLIQSAVIPFMLTAVKLFLLKSLMAGKLAIFLLLLGAFKNFTKKDRDVYVKDLPDRRYEPSSEGFAYLAEGRPSGWVN